MRREKFPNHKSNLCVNLNWIFSLSIVVMPVCAVAINKIYYIRVYNDGAQCSTIYKPHTPAYILYTDNGLDTKKEQKLFIFLFV